MENPIKMDDLGVSLCLETPILKRWMNLDELPIFPFTNYPQNPFWKSFQGFNSSVMPAEFVLSVCDGEYNQSYINIDYILL